CGDLEPDPGEDWMGAIESEVAALIDRGLRPLCLGGDHSITYPILKAVANRCGKISILHFDAHPDLYDEFQGNRYSHASPFARIMEDGLADRLVQVGIRTMNGHQREQAERFGVEVIDMKGRRDDRIFEFDSPLYISFDMDGLDPSCAPGVSHREPGGLSVREALGVIQSTRGRVVGADVVEFNPLMDPMNMTSVVCAKLVKEISAKMLAAPPAAFDIG
ncbi:MAG TPA: arginase family protein, partial [Blastocatellia bacterium]|nr:arginase family protein [Blastocatellia bacterium]